MKIDAMLSRNVRETENDAAALEAAGYDGLWFGETEHDPLGRDPLFVLRGPAWLRVVRRPLRGRLESRRRDLDDLGSRSRGGDGNVEDLDRGHGAAEPDDRVRLGR